ncbi:unnamed protein product [Arctogadus glacialis]
MQSLVLLGPGPHCWDQDLTGTSLLGPGPHCWDQDLTAGTRTSLLGPGPGPHCWDQDLTAGTRTSLGPHWWYQDLTAGTRTSLLGPGPHCWDQDQDLTAGTRTSLLGPGPHCWDQDLTAGTRTSLLVRCSTPGCVLRSTAHGVSHHSVTGAVEPANTPLGRRSHLAGPGAPERQRNADGNADASGSFDTA